MAKQTPRPSPKVPFFARLLRHREHRALSAQEVFLQAARAIAAGDDPDDVEGIDRALHDLGREPEDLQTLADLLIEERALAGTAAGAEAAQAALRAATADLAAEAERRTAVIAEANEAVARATSKRDRAASERQAAQIAESRLGEIRRQIAEAVDPGRVETLRKRLEVLRTERMRLKDVGSDLPGLRADLAWTERELAKLGAGDGDAHRRDLEARRDHVQRRLAELEASPQLRRASEVEAELAAAQAELETYA
jgi:chromosome segregation ATPase